MLDKTKQEKYLPVILLMITVLLYANTLMHGFVLDDEAVITKNKFVQKGFAGLPDIFATFYWQGYWDLNSGLYRPLSLVMFAIEWQLSPNNPFIHHLINILLYAGSIFLLYRFLRRLFKDHTAVLPFSIALLFAVHPVHTEVVANIKSRDELLCFVFLVLMADNIVKHKKATWLSCVYMLLALLSKEAAVMFLPVLGLMLYQLRAERPAAIIKGLWPLGVVTVVWLAWRAYILQHAPARVPYTYADNSLLVCDGIVSRVLTAITLIGKYLLILVWPQNLSYDYSYNQVPCADFGSGALWLSLICIAGLITVAVRTFRTKPFVSFGILFFFITIFLTSNLVFIIGATMADRFLFIPSLGIIMAACYYLFERTRSLTTEKMQNTATRILLPVAVLLAIVSFQRNRAWASNFTLFGTDAAHVPQSARAHYNYGTALLNTTDSSELSIKEQYAEALQQLQQAYDIDPNDANTLTNLGVANYRNEHYPEAISFLQKALSKNPNEGMIMLDLADAFLKQGQWDSVLYYNNAAIAQKVILPQTHNKLGTAYFNLKRYPEAADAYAAGIKRYPDNAELWLNYGNALAVQAKYPEAITAFEKAYALDNGQVKALYFLALTHQNIGNGQKANEYLKAYRDRTR